jgi:hypothetical protein
MKTDIYKPIHSLMQLPEFKATLGSDDQDDKPASFCLVTATYEIEKYCNRQLLYKGHFEVRAECLTPV